MKKRNAEVPGWKQNDYLFEIVEGRSLRISSNFESGNIRLVRQNNHLSVVML